MDSDKTHPEVEVAPHIEAPPRYIRSSTEPLLWALLSCILAGAFGMVTLIKEPSDLLGSTILIIGVISSTLFFVFVFRLIFGTYPVKYIITLLKGSHYHPLQHPTAQAHTGEKNLTEIYNNKFSTSVLEKEGHLLESKSPTELFASYVIRSRHVAENIYTRAGVYLLVGVIVAFSGLVFFYSQTANTVYHDEVRILLDSKSPPRTERLNHSSPEVLMSMASKFGILFFIEIVAFFFLRQYRSAMDEFRYYEAIKRKREETLALLILAEKSGKQVDIAELLKIETFFSSAGKLSAGESSEIIESRKLEKNELDLLEKVVEVLSRSKK